MEYDKVAKALTTAADENDAFLVDLEIKPNNVIVAYVDADTGLTIEQIKMINRKVESLLDRDEEDFNLTVSSPDLTRPLKIWRQYKKNEGRYRSPADHRELPVKMPWIIELIRPPVAAHAQCSGCQREGE